MSERVSEDSLLHLAVAIDTKSEPFGKLDMQALELLPDLKLNPLSWMAGPVSLDVGDSLLWESVREPYDPFTSLFRAPAVLRFESNSPLKLALFMTALKTTVDQSAPDSVKWQTMERNGRKFVKVAADQSGLDEMTFYYATMPKALLFALDEDALLAAMERESIKPDNRESAPPPAQLQMDVSRRFAGQLADYLQSTSAVRRVQTESWKAIPILNEWHRMFPDQDPVSVEMQHYATDISCPGGRGYRWNGADMTMESVAYGHPAAPRDDAMEKRISPIASLRTGLQFQDGGLRAHITLGDAPPRFKTPEPVIEPVELATAASLTPLIENRRLTYEGNSKDGKQTMTLLTHNIHKDGNAAAFDVAMETTDHEGTKTSTAISYKLDGALTFVKITSTGDGGLDYITPALDLPEKLIAGEVTTQRDSGIWSYIEDGKLIKEPYKGIKRIRVVGLEDVTVPAGTFSGCICIETTVESLHGSEYDVWRQIDWYHPGTGLVKFQERSGSEAVQELSKIEIVPADD